MSDLMLMRCLLLCTVIRDELSYGSPPSLIIPLFLSSPKSSPPRQSEDEGACGFTAWAGCDATTPRRRLFHAPIKASSVPVSNS